MGDEIFSAESVERDIKNHSHYGPCLNGSRYSTFCEKTNELDKCKNYRNEADKLKEDIIKEYNNLKLKEKKKNQNKEIFEKECYALKEKFETEENLKIENNTMELKAKEEHFKNNKEERKNILGGLEKDINYLKDLIETLKENKEDETEKRKEDILNKLEHEYELKIDRYEMEKEYQKIEKEEIIKYKLKEIQREKKLEFTELRYKSNIVNKLIYLFKANNFMINNYK